MTKCIKHIRDLFKYALYKFILYLLTYLHFIYYCHSPATEA